MPSQPHRLRSPRAGSALRMVAVLLALGCASWACRQAPARHPGDLVHPADVVLTGAVIYTMDPPRPRAEAIAIRAGRIVHVGSGETVQPFIAAETRVEDLGGQTVLPGLHDSHMHLIAGGVGLSNVSLSAATTVQELQAAIAARAAEKPDEPWIRGRGWDVSLFEGKLHRSQLDAAVADRPAYMVAADGHSAWVNSAALAAAGIVATTRDPPGGTHRTRRRGRADRCSARSGHGAGVQADSAVQRRAGG